MATPNPLLQVLGGLTGIILLFSHDLQWVLHVGHYIDVCVTHTQMAKRERERDPRVSAIPSARSGRTCEIPTITIIILAILCPIIKFRIHTSST